MRGSKSESDGGRRRARLLVAAAVGGLAAAVGLSAAPQARAADSTTSFASTGSVETFTVPAGITSLTITAVGAGGGAASGSPRGGRGGAGTAVTATFAVSPGDVLHVIVGGGGAGGSGSGGGAGGGGGSFVFAGGTLLLAAGGGGGGGSIVGGSGPGGNASTSTGGGAGGIPGFGGGAGGSGGAGGHGDSGGGGGGTTGAGADGGGSVHGAGGGQTVAAAGGTGGAGGDSLGLIAGDGGFGGGGGGAGDGGGGGGGGYSGGGGGDDLSASADGGGGGGGGSFVDAAGTSVSFATGASGGASSASATAASGADGSVSIVYTLLPQAITFADPGPQTFGTAPTVSASSDAGLAVAFSSATPGVCTVDSGGTLAFLTTGSCTIDADQAGTSTYAPAAQVSHTFTVAAISPAAPTGVTATAGDRQATVSFTAGSDGGTTTSYKATASGVGGPTVSCAASPCTVGGLTNGRSYRFTVTATNSVGSATSAASNAVTPKAAQTISFANPGTQEYDASPTLSATSDSGLAVVFSSATASVCTVSGGILSFHANGSCTIDADQPGNSAFLAAATVAQTFAVEGAPEPAPTPTPTPTQPSTSPSSSTPAAAPVPTHVALLDTEPPSAPSLRARFAGAVFRLAWSGATDDVGVDHYQLYRNGKPLVQAPGDALTLSLHRYGAGRFTLVAFDAAGNRSDESSAVTTVRNARPAHLRKWIPHWAWTVLRWQEHGKLGTRPDAPKKLPAWYWTWQQWRLHPFRLAG
jgi:hypothetical protein